MHGDIWVSGDQIVLPWAEVQIKFNFVSSKSKKWTLRTKKNSYTMVAYAHAYAWEDMDITLPGQWISLYKDGEEDMTFAM